MNLSSSKTQRIVNGTISLAGVIWLYSIIDDVYWSSGTHLHNKFYLLFFITCMYILQTVLNHKWLNLTIQAIYGLLFLYVIYTYVYAFFDSHDHVMKKDYGMLIKTWGTLVKSAIFVSAIWLTRKIRPYPN